MKRLTLLLGAAAVAAISSAPVSSARAQTGCSWWDLTCNGMATRVVDYGWHMTGRDQNGNVVYLRRRVDSNGNLIFEQARRNDYGRYLVLNNHTIRNGSVFGPNGERCKYNENEHGYKEECKYAKGTIVSGVRYPSNRFGTTGTDCKYQSNEKGYKEECKYAKTNNVNKVYKAPKVHTTKYEPIKYHPVKYHPIHYPRADVKGAKGHEGKDVLKDKGPKH